MLGAANTHSLVALNPDDCSTAEVQGTALVHIYPKPGYTGAGGFVQVNSDCGTPTSDDNCGTSGGGGALDINGTADLYATKVNVHGSCKGSGGEPHGDLDQAATQVADPLAGLTFPAIPPVCPRRALWWSNGTADHAQRQSVEGLRRSLQCRMG